jgi:peptidoglycan/xylan/chitin deacetylase (PgdA/CDA1 family)
MKSIVAAAMLLLVLCAQAQEDTWIRVNGLGYLPQSKKVAVWCSKGTASIDRFQLVDSASEKVVFSAKASDPFGTYGPFRQTYRLDFSAFKKGGTYFLKAGNVQSPAFRIGNNVYAGTADFVLRYMRQQRSGFNPYLKDSCHTQDGYVVYGEEAGLPASATVDVSGGWHDASDYLQYATTSANATYHLLMAYRDFPTVFTDVKASNGLNGANGRADVLDEAKWGLDWLLKMHPKKDQLFNQIADDRDHQGMRIPGMDSFYGRGFQRPVYLVTGAPQGLFKYKNRTTGTSSTAAKFSSAFSLGAQLLYRDTAYATKLAGRATSAMEYSYRVPGVTQTAPGRAPYFYEEDNWADDMELAYAAMNNAMAAGTSAGGDKRINKQMLDSAFAYAGKEKVTPWLGSDTAKHYQWYPFINLGHYELAKGLTGARKNTLISYYRRGIERVLQKASANAFYRGIPFIWCSNNLTTSFAIQCYWYRQLTGDVRYLELEAANFDWLFGVNPWGTSMVYGLPFTGDTPVDSHSAFTHLKGYPIDGGLVDGPVSGSIYNNLIGIKLYEPDEYAAFQSSLAVYHDDYGDYSTNEPTMDGTASLVYLLAANEASARSIDKRSNHTTSFKGALSRGDSTQKRIALVFTADEFGEGGAFIRQALKDQRAPAAFFFTGRFYRNPAFESLIRGLKSDGHYLGAHSDQHLLYTDWLKRDSLLVTKEVFTRDLEQNYAAMQRFGIPKGAAKYFLPPYEWYNDTIAAWTKDLNLQLVNYTPGTLSHTDYTTPHDRNYRNSEAIYRSVTTFEAQNRSGLNGYLLLMHVGAGPERKDKFYAMLPKLLRWVRSRGYGIVGLNELLAAQD